MAKQSANSKKLIEPNAIGRLNVIRRLLALGSTAGLFGGTWVFIAAAFSTIYNFLFNGKPQESWLFLAVLPLWILGAVCLDLREDLGNKNL